MSDRILFNGEKGTVKYRGKLQHKVDSSKIKVDEEWLGVEWDNKDKGKHDGTVDGFKYFEASAPKAGSLVLAKKAEFGQEVVEALVRRYFKDHEVNEILRHKEDIVQFLKDKWEKNSEKLGLQHLEGMEEVPKKAVVKPKSQKDTQKEGTEPQENKKTEEKSDTVIPEKGDDHNEMFEDDEEGETNQQSTKKESRSDAVEKLLNKIKDKDCYTEKRAFTEYDEDAIINTFKNRYKRIEFKGFDKIWERIYNMDRIVELCLSNQRIANLGSVGGIGKIVSNLKNLTLENNLLHNWSQIIILGSELPRLESLSVSYNKLKMDPEGYQASQLQSYNNTRQIKIVEDKDAIFPALTKLIAIETGLSFAKLNKVMIFMPKLKELVLCKNDCNDLDNMESSLYQPLVSINLEDNAIDDMCNLSKLSSLPLLRDLALNHNRLNRFPEADKFVSLENLNLSHNAVIDGKIITDLSKSPKLKSLKINYNPMEESINKKDIARRAVAEISTLTRINAMDLGRYERKDCEYYFLRWVFHEYFRIHNLHQLSYKFADFSLWATLNYPSVFELIKKHDNPYPEVQIQADDLEMEKALKLQAPAQQPGRFTKLIISALVGPLSGKPPISKVFPRTTDFLYIRNWVSQTFQIKNKEAITMKFKNSHAQIYEAIEDWTKSIEFYDIKDNADCIVEEK